MTKREKLLNDTAKLELLYQQDRKPEINNKLPAYLAAVRAYLRPRKKQ